MIRAPEAVAAFVAALEPGSEVAVLPEGPYVFARPRSLVAEPA